MVCRGLFSIENYANSLRQLGFHEADPAQGGSDRLIDAAGAWGDVTPSPGASRLISTPEPTMLPCTIDGTLEDSLPQLAAIRPSLPTHACP
jgi:hypothetical protein